jgi:hypothetical protein
MELLFVKRLLTKRVCFHTILPKLETILLHLLRVD